MLGHVCHPCGELLCPIPEDFCRYAESHGKVHKLIDIERVRAVIGPFGPAPTFALAPLAKSAGVVLVAVSLCEERFIPLKNVFCAYPSVRDQIEPLLTAITEARRRPHSMAVLFEQAEVTEFFQRALKEFAAKNHIAPLSADTFPAGEHNFRSYLARIKQAQPELLAIGTWPATALELLRQIREGGLKARYIWYFSELDAGIIKQYAALFEGVYFAGVPEDPAPWFGEAVRQRLGRKPDFYHSAGHDAALCLMEALSANPAADAAALTQRLLASPCSGTANPEFRFDANRAVKSSLVVKLARGGSAVPLADQ